MGNGDFYRENMIRQLYAPAFNRTTGEDKLFDSLDNAVFMQDGAPSHMANLTQELCAQVFPAFWKKDFWPGNSPDINPVENLWSIMESKVYCPPLATNKDTLVKKIRDAWEYLNLWRHTILPNLLEGERGWKKRCWKVIENQEGESS